MNSCYLRVESNTRNLETDDCARLLERMYIRWAYSHGYKMDHVNEELWPGPEGFFLHSTHRVDGDDPLSELRGEHGIHRVVRVSPFDEERRRHTSFVGVNVAATLEDLEQPLRGGATFREATTITSPVTFGPIRSYVFDPYELVKDYRTMQTFEDVEKVTNEGYLDPFIEAWNNRREGGQTHDE